MATQGDAQVGGHHDEYALSDSAYRWSVRLFSTLTRLLKVQIRLHGDRDQLRSGQIFVFNHFSRFETLVPQYLIHRETGAYSRAIASHEFFAGDDLLSRYLRSVGAVPNNLPGLLPFLAAELLAGRKLVIFPEGGMVKDRRVLDAHGAYSVYSPTSRARRKHHRGPAVLAQTLDAFKAGLLACERAGEHEVVARWAGRLNMESPAALLEAAGKPTLVVPANITFYPLRVDDNLLRKAAELLPGELTPRMVEELKIEGNILLRDTDMDIRLGAPVTSAPWRYGSEWLVRRKARRAESLADYFVRPEGGQHGRLLRIALARRIARTRDAAMHGMYTGVTLNLSHLASMLLFELAEQGVTVLPAASFRNRLYQLVKQTQQLGSVYLHDSLDDPDRYLGLLDEGCDGLRDLLEVAVRLGLVEVDAERLALLPKLTAAQPFERVRVENPLAVYANEASPVRPLQKLAMRLAARPEALTGVGMAALMIDDECRLFERARQQYSEPRYAEINDTETATVVGAPFLLGLRQRAPLAALMVHGFLASPAEVRGCAERLEAAGVPTVGVRLSGHGTSPWDLREQSWQAWLESVRRGYRIAACMADRVTMVGFSTGAALSLLLAAERPAGLCGVVAVAPTLRFVDSSMRFVPLIHHANRLISRTVSDEGLMPFREHVSEHPDVNYRHVPIRGLFELMQLVDRLKERLPEIDRPVLLIQASEDPVVVAAGSETIYDGLTSAPVRRLCWIDSDRHGILYEDIGGTQQMVVDFVTALPLSDVAVEEGA